MRSCKGPAPGPLYLPQGGGNGGDWSEDKSKKTCKTKRNIEFKNYQIPVPSPWERGWGEAE